MRAVLLATLLGFLTLGWAGPVHADEIAERNAIRTEVTTLLEARDFQRLSEIGKLYRETEARTPSGVWKLSQYYDAIYGYLSSSIKCSQYLDKYIEEWLATTPDSPPAIIAYAKNQMIRGYCIRGVGYSADVKPENWAPFQERVERARDFLLAHMEIGSEDPQWYAIMVDVAISDQWSEQDFKNLLEIGTFRHPYYYNIYFYAANYYLPKWYGDLDRVDRFARWAASRTKSRDGDGLYARIYWSLSQSEFQDYTMFQETSVSWDLMKKGMRDVIKKYPDQWNINTFAKFSCMAGDPDETRFYFEKVAPPLMSPPWINAELRESCRNNPPMAFRGYPLIHWIRVGFGWLDWARFHLVRALGIA